MEEQAQILEEPGGVRGSSPLLIPGQKVLKPAKPQAGSTMKTGHPTKCWQIFPVLCKCCTATKRHYKQWHHRNAAQNKGSQFCEPRSCSLAQLEWCHSGRLRAGGPPLTPWLLMDTLMPKPSTDALRSLMWPSFNLASFPSKAD